MKELHKELVPLLDEIIENVIEQGVIHERDYVTSQFLKALNKVEFEDIDFIYLLKILKEWDIAEVEFFEGQGSYIKATRQTKIFRDNGGFKAEFEKQEQEKIDAGVKEALEFKQLENNVKLSSWQVRVIPWSFILSILGVILGALSLLIQYYNS